jgi:hypothetical protein
MLWSRAPGRQWRTSCDTETGHEIICNGPYRRLPVKRGPVGGHKSIDGDSDNEGDVKPIDMLVPIGPGDGFIGDVRLLRIITFVAVWL